MLRLAQNDARLALDGRVRQVAPLLPGAIVVLHVRIAQDVAQHEPCVGRTHAELAVGGDGPLPLQPAVQRRQLLPRSVE